MSKIWDIAQKNLKVQFRDKKTLMLAILMPIMIYGLLGAIFGGLGADNGQKVYLVGWVDLDSTTAEGNRPNLGDIRDILNSTDEIEIIIYLSNESAMIDIQNKEIDAYVVFMDGYESYLQGLSSEPDTPILFYFHTSTNDITRNIISGIIMGVFDNVVNYNPYALKFNYENLSISGKKINDITQITPGFILYGVLNSLTGAVILITTEKKDGTLKRLEVSEIEPRDMILGHLISNTALIILQFVVGIAVLSIFGFSPYYSSISSYVLGIVITILLLAFFLNALVMVMSGILKKPEAAVGGVIGILVPMLMFSGAFVPLDVMAPGLIPYVAWIPTRIVVIIFQELMLNASTAWAPKVLLQYLWLALEGILFFVIGNKMYRRFVQSN